MSSSPAKTASPARMPLPALWQKTSVSRLAGEFFWIGGSIVATPKWRMGQIGICLPAVLAFLKNVADPISQQGSFPIAPTFTMCHQDLQQSFLILLL
ncbi:UNVERIFIED_CONTAM: hypothetical protein FKN15_016494 [Acipenser sinensis]